jgi:hypothetical protein
MPGFLSNGVCFDSQQDAVDNYFSTIPVFQYTNLYNNQMYTVYKPDPASPAKWSKYSYVLSNNTLAQAQQLLVPVLPSCYSPLDAYADGQQIGWEFVLVISSVLILMVVRRLF